MNVNRPSGARVAPRNRIYKTAFDKAWVDRHLPQDLERQRKLVSYRHLALIAAGVAVVLGVIGVAAGLLLQRERAALQLAQRAEAAANAASRDAAQERDNARAAATKAEAALSKPALPKLHNRDRPTRSEIARSFSTSRKTGGNPILVDVLVTCLRLRGKSALEILARGSIVEPLFWKWRPHWHESQLRCILPRVPRCNLCTYFVHFTAREGHRFGFEEGPKERNE